MTFKFTIQNVGEIQLYEFSDRDTAIRSLINMGIDCDEIYEALKDMLNSSTDTAHFGIKKTFISSEMSEGNKKWQ